MAFEEVDLMLKVDGGGVCLATHHRKMIVDLASVYGCRSLRDELLIETILVVCLSELGRDSSSSSYLGPTHVLPMPVTAEISYST